MTNFRGIELRDFPAEIARLALIIAEFQCDVLYRGQKEALAEFLPLDAENWITCGNALRLDWLSVCPPTGTGVKHHADDLFHTPLDQAQIDFENEGGETYICGNPPYFGSRRQQNEQKSDLRNLAEHIIPKWKSLDYIAGWLLKARVYSESQDCRFSFVCTSSMAEGLQVALVWPHILRDDRRIYFAHRPFTWSNLAKGGAGVTVVIMGVASADYKAQPRIYDRESVQVVDRINPYLVPGQTTYVESESSSLAVLPRMVMGSMPRDGGNLILDPDRAKALMQSAACTSTWVRRYLGSNEIINGMPRYCLWLKDNDLKDAYRVPDVAERLNAVKEMRFASPLTSTKEFADRPHRFVYLAGESASQTIAVGGVSSNNREYFPVGVLEPLAIVSNLAFAIYDGPLWCIAIIGSRLHMAWIATVCGRLRTDPRYSNTLGWNTFPVPTLTEKNKSDLTRCAEDILLAREAHFPATIADLYDPEKMPADLREAHERNDEVLERIYIGRRFRNDTERLERLFEMYTKLVGEKEKPRKSAGRKTAA